MTTPNVSAYPDVGPLLVKATASDALTRHEGRRQSANWRVTIPGRTAAPAKDRPHRGDRPLDDHGPAR